MQSALRLLNYKIPDPLLRRKYRACKAAPHAAWLGGVVSVVMVDTGNEVQLHMADKRGLRPICCPHAFPATRVEAVVQNQHDLLLWLQFEQRLNIAPYSLATMISIKQNKTDRPSLLVQFRYHIPQYPGRISRTEFDVWEFTG